MTVLTERQYAGEFLVSEGPGSISREKGTLKSGEVVIDGCVLAIDGASKLVAASGDSGEDVVGIAYGAHDATGADKPNVPYIARLAEVKEDLVTPKAAGSVDWDALNALNIIAR